MRSKGWRRSIDSGCSRTVVSSDFRDSFIKVDIVSLFIRSITVSDAKMLYDNYEEDSLEVTMDVANVGEIEGYIDIPLNNYKGYRAVDTITGEELQIGDGRNCCIRIYFEPGYQGNVHVYFREPALWRGAELFSLISILAGGFYLWWTRRKKMGT